MQSVPHRSEKAKIFYLKHEPYYFCLKRKEKIRYGHGMGQNSYS